MAVIWIVTAFTLAHSLTLALASFGIIRIPARVIEPLIALTILATALNNVWPVVTAARCGRVRVRPDSRHRLRRGARAVVAAAR